MAEEKRNLVTEEGLRKLQEQYDYLVNVKRKEIINAIEIARGFGDLSENAEYTEARNEQAKNEAEITRLKSVIDNAVVVSENEISTDRVSVGTTVRYLNVTTGKETEYAIVGADEPETVPVFADHSSVPAWAQGSLYALSNAGIFTGTGSGNLSPNASLSRAQTAQILLTVKKIFG